MITCSNEKTCRLRRAHSWNATIPLQNSVITGRLSLCVSWPLVIYAYAAITLWHHQADVTIFGYIRFLRYCCLQISYSHFYLFSGKVDEIVVVRVEDMTSDTTSDGERRCHPVAITMLVVRYCRSWVSLYWMLRLEPNRMVRYDTAKKCVGFHPWFAVLSWQAVHHSTPPTCGRFCPNVLYVVLRSMLFRVAGLFISAPSIY